MLLLILLSVIIIIAVVDGVFIQNEIEFKEIVQVRSEPLDAIGGLSLYDYYRSLDRLNTNDYAAYVLNPFDDAYLQNFSKSMDIEEIITYVRNDISYKSEGDVEYPKYPVETIVEKSGDCEDQSILLVQLLSLKGENVSLVRFKNHMSVLYNGSLIESTSDVNNHKLKDATDIYPITSRAILGLTYEGMLCSEKGRYFAYLNITLYNYGNMPTDAVIGVYDNISSYSYNFSIDSYSMEFINWNLEVKSMDIVCKLEEE